MEVFVYHLGLVLFGLVLGAGVGIVNRRRMEKRWRREIRKEVLIEFERRAIPARVRNGYSFGRA